MSASAPAWPALTVIVPVFNEAVRIEENVATIRRELGPLGMRELILVDDGSTDDTSARLSALAAEDPSCRVVRYDENRGKGYAVRLGMQLSTCERVLFTDADLSTPLEELRRLSAVLEEGYDLVMGSRAMAESVLAVHQPRYRELLGRAANRLLRAVDPTLAPFSDTQCGFKLFKGDVARLLASRQTIERWGFDFELVHIAIKYGLRVAEVPVTWAHSGQSSLTPADYLRTFSELLKVMVNDARGLY